MNKRNNLNICFTTPAKSAYSETFLHNLMKGLPGNVLHCYDGWLPAQSADSQLKNYKTAGLIDKGLQKLGLIKGNLGQYYFKQYLKDKKVDLIIANYGPAGAAVARIAAELNIPLLVHFHGFDASVDEVLEKHKVAYEKMFALASAIVAVSKEMHADIIKLGAKKEKLHHITYAPAAGFLKIQPNYASNQLLAIGRFVEKKAPYLTLLAFQKAVSLQPVLKLKMVGDGPLLQICKDMAASLAIPNVTFAGVLSAQQIMEEFAQSFCFVQHSKRAGNGDKEGTPVSVLEAMAAALPVISTYHAGIPDVITNEHNGLLVNEGDVDSMAQHMIRLFNDRSLARDFGLRGRKLAEENYHSNVYFATWNRLIYEVMN